MKEFFKMLKNRRWEVRYKNLEKKFNDLIEENKKLKEKFDENHLTKLINDKNSMIRRQKSIIKNLREDNKRLMEKKGE